MEIYWIDRRYIESNQIEMVKNCIKWGEVVGERGEKEWEQEVERKRIDEGFRG